MVDKASIDENISKAILRKELEDIVTKSFLEVVKCTDNSATKNGEGAEMTMAKGGGTPDNMLPKRLTQHKGYDEDGNDLGYIEKIEYPSGFTIDYVGGKITFPDGREFDQSFLDNNKKDSNGNLMHDKMGTNNAERTFDYQFKEAEGGSPRSAQSMMVQIGELFKGGSSQNLMEQAKKNGIPLAQLSRESTNPRVKKLYESWQWMMRHKGDENLRADVTSYVAGRQISVSDMNMRDATRINSTLNGMESSSVGRLNDKTINATDSVTGDTRSINGKVNNWDNTWKVYTCVSEGDGTHAMYLGYPQNAKAGVTDNSGNVYNDMTFFEGQNMKRVMVDKTNHVIIQVPVNE